MELLTIGKCIFEKDLKTGLYDGIDIKTWEDLTSDEIDLYMVEAIAYRDIPESEWPFFIVG